MIEDSRALLSYLAGIGAHYLSKRWLRMTDWHPDDEALELEEKKDVAKNGDERPVTPATVDHAPEVAAVRNGYAADGAEPRQAEGAGKPGMVARQIDRWVDSMERLHLAEYVRYVDDRKRMFWNHFWGGVARGVGMAVGFTILGAVLVLILQNLAKRNLPLIGDVLAQIVTIVQTRLK